MDFWSFARNDEENAVIMGHNFGEQMEAMFSRDLAKSKEILLDQWEKRPLPPDSGTGSSIFLPPGCNRAFAVQAVLIRKRRHICANHCIGAFPELFNEHSYSAQAYPRMIAVP
jgi:hypothetical protein